MLNALIRFSLTHRFLVVALAALLFVYGGYILMRLPVDVFPDLNRPTVTIFTEAEGLAPEEVEALVTWPIETGINGSTGVERVRSASGIGLSIVWVEFGWSTDVYRARQIVAEKLQQVKERLPANANPAMGPIASIMGEIMLVGLTADDKTISPLELRTLAEWDMRNRLLALPGVAQVTVIGGDMKQFQVLLDPLRLKAYGKSLHDVEAALSQSNVNSTGGFMLKDYQEYLIRNMARVRTLEDLQAIPLIDEDKKESQGAAPVTLAQVADIQLGGPLAKRGDASINGAPAVILSIQKQPGADTVALTKAITKSLEELRAALPKGVTIHDDIFRQSSFITRAIANVSEALRDGSILVVVVLFLFLLNLRTTFITLTAIPLSFVVTALIFHWAGISINTMTLGGLAIAVGELVDDAIIGVENVARRLRENRQLPNPRNAMTVVYEASSEVRNSIVFATVIVLLVFVPLFAMQGIEGKIFAPLGIAYIVSIAASMLVSLTVTPALSMLLLGNARKGGTEHGGLLVRLIKSGQRALLGLLLPVRHAVFVVLGVVFIGTVLLFTTFGKEFLPEFNEGSVTINLLSPPGTSLAESNRIGSIAEKLLLEVPEATKTGRRTGRAERDDHAEGVHSSEIEVELEESDRSRKDILAEIRAKLDGIPGIAVNIGQPISHRIDHMLSGVRAQIAVKLFGDDLATLRAQAEAIRAVMAEIPGIVDLAVEPQILIPQVHVRIDRSRASQNGVLAGEVAEYAQLAMQGRTVTEVLDGQRTYDVVMRLTDAARKDIESLRAIPVDVAEGQSLPLGLLADVDEAKGPNIINRENARRRIVIQANVEGRDLVGVVEKLQQRVNESVHLPTGYYLTYGGQFESQASASRMIAILSLFSLGGMFLVLFTHFRDANLALQVMASIPLAFIGAVIGVWLTGGVFSIATMVGFVTLTGIAARNGIMMIAHYLHLMEHEGERFDLAMLYRGSSERIIPVLMTALTASLALIPLMISAEEPGREILHPVAVVIFSGLVSSTLLDLAVRPLIFWSFGRRPPSACHMPFNPKRSPHDQTHDPCAACSSRLFISSIRA